MSRRVTFIIFFVLFGAGVMWYASAHVRIPEKTISEAMKISDVDHKARVMVPGKVDKSGITAQGESLTFTIIDAEGTRSEVLYTGEQTLVAGQISDAAEKGKTISVAGHYCEGKFKAVNVYLPAY
jgi:hypothetical protein